MPATALEDRFQRRFSYLRLSVTDACNFRCVYCLPNGYARPCGSPEPLGLNEIENLARGFARLGLWKVRVTGGEPTLRRDLVEILSRLSAVPGVRRLALSTNGSRLHELAPSLRAVGLHGLNVSVDSLDAARFRELTGRDELKAVLSGIEAALEAGIPSVKINAVLMKGVTELELDRFLDYLKARPISVRFIELMPTAGNQALFRERHVTAGFIRARLDAEGWVARPRSEGDGPAIEYRHSGFRGSLGLIAPYSKDFCASCNRLRVTAQGGLRLCLFGEKDVSLRRFLESPDQAEELIAAVRGALVQKDVSHFLDRGAYGNNATFSAMGG